jgi:hypothetical protein
MRSAALSRRGLPIGVKKYKGTDMEAYLQKHPTVLYRYTPNTYGLLFLGVLGVIAGGFAVLIWFGWGLSTVWQVLGASLSAGVFLLLTLLVSYWVYYTRIHYVATSDRHLLIGKGKKVVAIRWDDLDPAALGFSENVDDKVAGVIHIKVDSHKFKLRLFGGFVWIDNLQGFMHTLLTHITANDVNPES